jgi:hypothetical protein
VIRYRTVIEGTDKTAHCPGDKKERGFATPIEAQTRAIRANADAKALGLTTRYAVAPVETTDTDTQEQT